MKTLCHFFPFLRQAAVLACLVLAGGCALQPRKGVVQSEPPPPPPVIITTEPPPAVPQPTEEDLVFESARSADANGDHPLALQLYDRAAELSSSDTRFVEIHYALALLLTDPASPTRDETRGRIELQRVIDMQGTLPHVREARILAALLDEISVLRLQSVEQKVETQTAHGDLAAMKTRLEDKEKELAEIKRILLQDRKKP